jgi:hypothetical protein
MKPLLIATAIALLGAGAASAEKAVSIPKNLDDPATAAAYTTELQHAVMSVCRQAATPVIGLNYFRYQSCLKTTGAALAKSEPTGLFAQKLGLKTTLASR